MTMIPTMVPGTWHTAIGQGIPLPVDLGQPLGSVAPVSLAAAAGIIASAVIAVVVREALHARMAAAESPGCVVSVRRAQGASAAVEVEVSDSMQPRRRPLSRALGFMLIGIAAVFGLGAPAAPVVRRPTASRDPGSTLLDAV